MTIAGQWYESGTLWSAVGAVATLLVGLGTIVITYRSYIASQPKRRLFYSIGIVADLGSYLPRNDSQIQVTKSGRKIEHPHIAEVRLKFTGRPDISSADWDGGKPLKLDLQVPIVSLAKVNTLPGEYAMPEAEVGGSTITLKPGLIKNGQLLIFTVLVDGSPRLSLESHLINVQVSRGAPMVISILEMRTLLWYAIGGFAAITASTFLDLTGQGYRSAGILIFLMAAFANYLWSLLKQNKKDVREAEKSSREEVPPID